ncbi:hypothetical protein NQD34_008175 [Periophthalmus magnuspinnatus]|nr:hypothetical protein NQD34_008175 [Periophthalmus magnuspinnatus]
MDKASLVTFWGRFCTGLTHSCIVLFHLCFVFFHDQYETKCLDRASQHGVPRVIWVFSRPRPIPIIMIVMIWTLLSLLGVYSLCVLFLVHFYTYFMLVSRYKQANFP